jgi:hypothetical protein
MALPPKGNPRRPMHLAIRSMRLLGIIQLCFVALTMLPMLLMMRRGFGMSFAVVELASATLYLVPGIMYLVCAIYLKRRAFWAIIVGISLASIQLLFLLIGAVAFMIFLIGAQPPGTAWIPLGVIGILILALVQLIYHLAKSFEAIKYPPDEQRGFEPLLIATSTPLDAAMPPTPTIQGVEHGPDGQR